LASNQRILIFGLGKAEGIDTLSVRWPNGTVQRFGNIAADGEILLREGNELTVLPSPEAW